MVAGGRRGTGWKRFGFETTAEAHQGMVGLDGSMVFCRFVHDVFVPSIEEAVGQWLSNRRRETKLILGTSGAVLTAG